MFKYFELDETMYLSILQGKKWKSVNSFSIQNSLKYNTYLHFFH